MECATSVGLHRPRRSQRRVRHQAIDVGDRLCQLRVDRNLSITEVVSCQDVKVGYLRDDHLCGALLSQ